MNYLPPPAADQQTPAAVPIVEDFASIGPLLKKLEEEKERERQSRKDDPA